MMKLKTKTVLLVIPFIIVLGVGLYFLCFSAFGRMMTIQFRSFEKISVDTYVNSDYMSSKEDVLKIISQAKARNKEFWGELDNEAIFIVCDDNKELEKLGNPSSAATNTVVFNGKVFTYIVITPKYLEVDVVAHELTHAELHHRLVKGNFINQTIGMPLWFDEGLALQNDYREQYNGNAWKVVTQNGQNVTSFTTLEKAEQFYNSDKEVRKYNYIISKHEVGEWLAQNRKEKLFDIIAGVRGGKDFKELYNK